MVLLRVIATPREVSQCRFTNASRLYAVRAHLGAGHVELPRTHPGVPDLTTHCSRDTGRGVATPAIPAHPAQSRPHPEGGE